MFVHVTQVATSARRPSHVELEPGPSGLAEVSYTKGEDIKSVSTQRLTRRLGDVPADRLDRIERVLRLLLGL